MARSRPTRASARRGGGGQRRAVETSYYGPVAADSSVQLGGVVGDSVELSRPRLKARSRPAQAGHAARESVPATEGAA